MFDCHYDLLTHIFMKQNDIYFIKNYCKKVYTKDNITGGIFNLFYMTKKEMKEEIDIEKRQIDVIENLRLVRNLIQDYNMIPNSTNYIFGMEGLDYLKKIQDIDILYDLGLRSTNIVWSNKNKFGSGVRKIGGLTLLGKKLVGKLVQKKIAIDLSHSNEETFYDIIKECKRLKKQGYDPIVFASHSNCKALCDVPRNLTDDQIKEIVDLNGVIGVVQIKTFIKNVEEIHSVPLEEYEKEYLNHIKHIKDLVGNLNHICVSTDDMKYYDIEPDYYQNLNLYKHNEAKKKTEQLLIQEGYAKKDIKKILEQNIKKKILNRLNIL